MLWRREKSFTAGNRTRTVRPVACCYTNWAILTPKWIWNNLIIFLCFYSLNHNAILQKWLPGHSHLLNCRLSCNELPTGGTWVSIKSVTSNETHFLLHTQCVINSFIWILFIYRVDDFYSWSWFELNKRPTTPYSMINRFMFSLNSKTNILFSLINS
jgi:hypothetical protein